MFPLWTAAIFFCCLTALRQGLLEYAAEEPKLVDQANRVGRLLEEGDLSPLYNPRRRLFHIGFDAQEKKTHRLLLRPFDERSAYDELLRCRQPPSA